MIIKVAITMIVIMTNTYDNKNNHFTDQNDNDGDSDYDDSNDDVDTLHKR